MICKKLIRQKIFLVFCLIVIILDESLKFIMLSYQRSNKMFKIHDVQFISIRFLKDLCLPDDFRTISP